jgi:hypothetical protein
MSNKETNEANFNHYLSELEFDLAAQHKSIEVLKKIQAIGTDFGLEINCDLVVSVIEFICRISSQGMARDLFQMIRLSNHQLDI